MQKDRRVYIFISHSHLDIDKVRVIRNYLESLQGEPILFFLLSQTDKNKITRLIEEEIEARIWFVLCDSKNARESTWVQSEIEFAHQIGKHNIVEIALDEAVIDGKVSDKYQRILSETYRKFKILSNIFVSYNHRDRLIVNQIDEYLNKFGIDLLSGSEDYFVGPGEDFFMSIEEYIKNSACALTFIGQQSSLAQPAEIALIEKYNKPVFYVRLVDNFSTCEEKQQNPEYLTKATYSFDVNNIETSSDGLIKWIFDRI